MVLLECERFRFFEDAEMEKTKSAKLDANIPVKADLADEEFIEGFENCSLPGATFHHEQHVRVVWLYLQRYSVIEALQRFSVNLKRFATANGKPNLYHETITWAYVFLINERIQRNGEKNWDEFKQANPDLLDWKNSILKYYYSERTLQSDLARKAFLFPDRIGS
jgi:hypothetical protein